MKDDTMDRADPAVDRGGQRALLSPEPQSRPHGRHEASRQQSVGGPAGAAIAVVLASVAFAGVLATWLISSAREGPAPDGGAATTVLGGPTTRPPGPGAFGNLVVNWSFRGEPGRLAGAGPGRDKPRAEGPDLPPVPGESNIRATTGPRCRAARSTLGGHARPAGWRGRPRHPAARGHRPDRLRPHLPRPHPQLDRGAGPGRRDQAGPLAPGKVRRFTTDTYVDELAANETWLAQGWSGDVYQAQDQNQDVSYTIPKEGRCGSCTSCACPEAPPTRPTPPAS